MLAAGDDAIVFLLVPVIIVLAVASLFWRRSRSLTIAEQWAAENGYELIRAEQAFLTTAFMFRKSKAQSVYRVVVRDADGRVRHGKLLCGGYFGGLMFSDRAVVKWDN